MSEEQKLNTYNFEKFCYNIIITNIEQQFADKGYYSEIYKCENTIRLTLSQRGVTLHLMKIARKLPY